MNYRVASSHVTWVHEITRHIAYKVASYMGSHMYAYTLVQILNSDSSRL